MPPARRGLGIEHNCCSRDARIDLLEQFEPLACNQTFVVDEPSDVATRACQTRNEALTDRIGNICEDYGCCGGFSVDRRRDRCGSGNDDVALQRDQLFGAFLDAVKVSARPPNLNVNVATLDPAQ